MNENFYSKNLTEISKTSSGPQMPFSSLASGVSAASISSASASSTEQFKLTNSNISNRRYLASSSSSNNDYEMLCLATTTTDLSDYKSQTDDFDLDGFSLLADKKLNFETRKKIERLKEEIRDNRIKLNKKTADITKEENKLNACNSTLQRHGINLFEWENYIQFKANQLMLFVHNFKLNVYYSNEVQLSRLLFKNRYFADLNAEIFDLQEKHICLIGIIRQLESVACDIRNRINELKRKQEPLQIKQSQLLNQFKRELSRLNANN